MVIRRFAITALAAALLSACAVGPNHVRPQVAVPERFGAATDDVGERAATIDPELPARRGHRYPSIKAKWPPARVAIQPPSVENSNDCG